MEQKEILVDFNNLEIENSTSFELEYKNLHFLVNNILNNHFNYYSEKHILKNILNKGNNSYIFHSNDKIVSLFIQEVEISSHYFFNKFYKSNPKIKKLFISILQNLASKNDEKTKEIYTTKSSKIYKNRIEINNDHLLLKEYDTTCLNVDERGFLLIQIRNNKIYCIYVVKYDYKKLDNNTIHYIFNALNMFIPNIFSHLSQGIETMRHQRDQKKEKFIPLEYQSTVKTVNSQIENNFFSYYIEGSEFKLLEFFEKKLTEEKGLSKAESIIDKLYGGKLFNNLLNKTIEYSKQINKFIKNDVETSKMLWLDKLLTEKKNKNPS